MLRSSDIIELLQDGILVDDTDEHLVAIGNIYEISDGYEMLVKCSDNENVWEKVGQISVKNDEVYISNENYWLENIVKIKILKMVKKYE